MAKVKFAPFSAADYLDDEKVIAEYLAAALEDPNPEVFLLAVANVAKARGIAKIAKDSGLGPMPVRPHPPGAGELRSQEHGSVGVF